MARVHGGAADESPATNRIIADARARIASAVRSRRINNEWTQEQLAEALGCTTTYLQRVEYGQSNVTLRFLGHLAAALDLDIAEMFVSVPASGTQRGAPRRTKKRRKPKQATG